MWQELGIAFCLILVLEGILPFLCPKQWRETLIELCRLSDGQLRVIGLVGMVSGTVLLYWLRG